ncbi:hypothetical protein MKEN_00349200 [Mycena kentingensis (nom. inval.)]|nr:hypothetical protein MKEN_00349200 [Mycena kentingensis (nom. inval.)]
MTSTMSASSSSRRKSMRRAADPCLGFYLVPPTDPDPPAPASPKTPHIAVLPCSSSPPSRLEDTDTEHVVTVDEFLRQTAVARPKTYGKRRQKKKRVVTIADPDYTSDGDSSEDAPDTPIIPLPRKLPLRKRLLTAAVSTNGDPDDILLPGGPLNHAPETAGKQLKFADPKKTNPPRSNSFTKPQLHAPISNGRTLSAWQKRLKVDGGIRKPRQPKKAARARCLPLTFIPLAEAEISYALMRGGPRAVLFKRSAASPVSERVPLDLHEPPSHVEVTPTPPPLVFDASVLPASRQPSPVSQQPIVQDPSASARHSPASMFQLPASLQHSPAQIAPAGSQSHSPQAPPLQLNPPPTEPLVPYTASPTTPVVRPTEVASDRPHNPPSLKPLGSFLDQFFETARAETQLSLETTKKTTRRRRPGTRRNENVVPTPPPRPISTLKSFIQKTVHENQVHSTSYSISSARFAIPRKSEPVDCGDDDFDASLFRAPALPNRTRSRPLSRSVQAPYQVVLSSTPPPMPEPTHDSFLTTSGYAADIDSPSTRLFLC